MEVYLYVARELVLLASFKGVQSAPFLDFSGFFVP